MSMIKLFGMLINGMVLTLRVALLFLPSLLVYVVLTHPEIIMNRGQSLVEVVDKTPIHALLSNTRWNDLKPCGVAFNEQEQFDQARECVNKKTWKKSPISSTLEIPRCFIVSASSPDVYSDKSKTFNFIPMVDMFSVGAVLGVYHPETRTVFIVENIDAAMVYRHETQHYMLHEHDPKTRGAGHDQDIWTDCEPPYYSPTVEAQMIAAIKEINRGQQ